MSTTRYSRYHSQSETERLSNRANFVIDWFIDIHIIKYTFYVFVGIVGLMLTRQSDVAQSIGAILAIWGISYIYILMALCVLTIVIGAIFPILLKVSNAVFVLAIPLACIATPIVFFIIKNSADPVTTWWNGILWPWLLVVRLAAWIFNTPLNF